MKHLGFFLILTIFLHGISFANPPEVSNAFKKAGVPLLDTAQPIIDFALDLIDGGQIRLSDLKGKVVFLNFWATWCPPCRSEMPSMEILYQRFRNRGFEMLAVNLRESKNLLVSFLATSKFGFPVLLDSNGRVGSSYNTRYIPTTFIIGKDGQIIATFIGGREWDTPDIITAFELLLNQ